MPVCHHRPIISNPERNSGDRIITHQQQGSIRPGMSHEAESPPVPGWTLLEEVGPFTAHTAAVYVSREGLGPGVLARYAFRVEGFHCNKRQTCHGGMLATFADIAMARGVCFAEGVVPPLPTISMSLDFMGPAPLGAWVEAHVSLGRLARGTAFVEAHMFVGDAPILRASAVFKRVVRGASA